MRILIRDARVFDPGRGIDRTLCSVLVDGPNIVSLDARPDAAADRVIDAEGLLLCPGLVDLRAELGEPGFSECETIHSAGAAAVRGGFSSVVMAPTTSPPPDQVEVVELVLARARAAKSARILPVGTISVGRQGERMAEMAKLRDAGCVAFSDGDVAIRDSQLLRYALEAADGLGLPVFTHAEDTSLSLGGVMHEGAVSTRLGLRGMPGAAEVVGVARDIALAELTGARLHIAHVSTGAAAELIRQAKRRGIRVSADVAPHHLWLTEAALDGYDSRAKLFPPLRTAEDVEAICLALRDGTIDAVASDHSPRTAMSKVAELERASAGSVGLETTLGVVLSLVARGVLTLERAIAALTRSPAQVLGRPELGRLMERGPADLVLIDPDRTWTVRPDAFRSKSRNSVFEGHPMRGAVAMTMVEGRVVWESPELSADDTLRGPQPIPLRPGRGPK